MQKPCYSEFSKYAPDLVDEDQKNELRKKLNSRETNLVIIGFESCPYSHKARNAVEKHIKAKGNSSFLKNKAIFIGGDWNEIDKLRDKVKPKHKSSFPVIFMRNKSTGKMDYFGGGTDLESFVDKDLES